ncbi:MAG: helix-turn-helix domain-containing protein [Candidatus Methanoperedens sp.]|nr:helix-turn-helix domain-containing protein [Candidatus Methanoperedens sp.]
MNAPEKRRPNHALRDERERRCWTQEYVAEKIGTSAVNISRWERGITYPTPYYRQKLCELFDLGPDVLFSYEPAKLEWQNGRGAKATFTSTFFFNVPLTDPHEFYGRISEWMTVRDRLRKRSSTSIVGVRRIGKTWLLTYMAFIAAQKFGSRVQIGYVDASMPSCSTLEGFLIEALKALKVPVEQLAVTPPDLLLMEQIIKKKLEGQQTPVLCIDEFESLCKCRGFRLDFLEHLRALTQIGFVLVTASKRPLIEVVDDVMGTEGQTSPFFNVFEQITLNPFSQREAEQFVCEKGTQAAFNEQERAFLLRYGQQERQQWPPLRLQLVGEMLEMDKMLAQQGEPERYRPQDPSYWEVFEKRLCEKYRGVVR